MTSEEWQDLIGWTWYLTLAFYCLAVSWQDGSLMLGTAFFIPPEILRRIPLPEEVWSHARYPNGRNAGRHG